MGTLTRRSLLNRALAAGLAAEILAPSHVLAAAAEELYSQQIGDLAPGSSTVFVAPRPFSLVGLEWQAPVDAQVSLRFRSGAAPWSNWVSATAAGHGPDAVTPQLIGTPLWCGSADQVQLRCAHSVSGATLHFVAAEEVGSAQAASYALAQPTLDAGAGQPPIIARSVWGANAYPRGAPEYGAVDLAFVHHSDSPNGYRSASVPAMLRAIFVFHRYVNGWNDIGYNFAIDAYGRIWEARGGGIALPVVGAQTGGYNLVSTGVVILGTFTGSVPSAAALSALENLLAWKLSLHGVPITGEVVVTVNPAGAVYSRYPAGAAVALKRISGHRDADATDCPGGALYAQLALVRAQTETLVTEVGELTLSAAASATAGVGLTASGTLTSLSGSPLAGEPIALGIIASGGALQTLATTTTGADGSFKATVTLSSDSLLCAVHPTFPATVSVLVEVTVAPALTISAVAGNPIAVTGTIAPSVAAVFIDLYAGGSLLSRTAATVGASTFSANVATPGAGTYVLVAHTHAGATNGAGGSAPVTVVTSA